VLAADLDRDGAVDVRRNDGPALASFHGARTDVEPPVVVALPASAHALQRSTDGDGRWIVLTVGVGSTPGRS
jgi:hypothetical protein